MDIFDPKTFKEEISIIGVGNIGSQTALALCRLGITKFRLYDPDTVAMHNLSSQSFFLKDIGSYKVNCIAKLLRNINNKVQAYQHRHKFTGKDDYNDYLIIAVDSMKKRRKIAEYMKTDASYLPRYIIDGRMGGPQLEIYTCVGVDEWINTMSDNPDKDPCSARYISYTSMIIGALIANQVKRVIKKETYKKEIVFNIDTLQLL